MGMKLDKMDLWTYWDYPQTRPIYISMCMEIIERNASSCIHRPINNSTVRDYLPRLRRDYKEIKNRKKIDDPDYSHACHVSDYIKTRILYTRGGLFVDADIILMPEFDKLVDLIINNFNTEEIFDYVGREQENGYVTVNFMHSFPRGKIITKFKKYQDQMLGESMSIPSGSAFAARLLTRAVEECRLKNSVYLLKDEVAPISFKNYNIFFCSIKDAPQLLLEKINRSYCVMLYNRSFPQWFKNLSKEEILRGDLLISHIFRKAYGLEQ